jgi:hypothetical protein
MGFFSCDVVFDFRLNRKWTLMSDRTILYVEDEENDVFIMRHAWKKAGLRNPLQVVTDGEQALAYLSGGGKYTNRKEHPIPCLPSPGVSPAPMN